MNTSKNMKPIKNQVSSIAGFDALSTESKLCFGAAGGCLVLGLVGYAINALSTTETTLSAFLVISAFYFMLGVISLFKSGSSVGQPQNITISERALSNADELEEEVVESAA
jgi:hypothetical protein